MVATKTASFKTPLKRLWFALGDPVMFQNLPVHTLNCIRASLAMKRACDFQLLAVVLIHESKLHVENQPLRWMHCSHFS